jgi:NADPH:quinone reductase-like Zn-dependent oxidoreductase
LTYDEAAALSFGGTTALHFLRRGKLQSGENVLVNGASGGVGTAAVQLAKHFGADVTGVCSTASVDLVRSLGADHVIDYTKENFTENREIYDVIVDTAGTAPFSRSKRSLREKGRHRICVSSRGWLRRENSNRSLIGAIRLSRSLRLTATSTPGARREMSSSLWSIS